MAFTTPQTGKFSTKYILKKIKIKLAFFGRIVYSSNVRAAQAKFSRATQECSGGCRLPFRVISRISDVRTDGAKIAVSRAVPPTTAERLCKKMRGKHTALCTARQLF